jgi:glyoxylase-like metal-dependent hydrolase (beta-lactamase superfamily II)
MDKPYQAMPDVEVLPAHFPIPGMGFLAVNAFVIKSEKPVLVDTGMGLESEAFMEALESIIRPQDLRWVWLPHDDADHTGKIQRVLEAAPGARLAAKMIFSAHLPPAQGKIGQFLDLFAKVPASTPFVAPNQTALEQMLAQAKDGS